MLKELEYPFDSEFILKKSKKPEKTAVIRPEAVVLKKNIAVLGGNYHP